MKPSEIMQKLTEELAKQYSLDPLNVQMHIMHYFLDNDCLVIKRIPMEEFYSECLNENGKT